MKICSSLRVTPRSAFVDNKNGIDVRNQAPLEGGRFQTSAFSWCIGSEVRGGIPHA
jgi:hypothetical protein